VAKHESLDIRASRIGMTNETFLLSFSYHQKLVIARKSYIDGHECTCINDNSNDALFSGNT
jgi:hypothetical protein